MTIIPAIDILGGRCVRLVQGDYAAAQEYEGDPVSVARQFEQAGARRIHIVDLDGARGNRDTNRRKIRKIRRAVSCTLELGGGIRSEDDIEELLDIGIDRLVLGTSFAMRPEIVEGWTAHYGRVFVAGIDSREGLVYVSGWERESSMQDTELAARARELGACSLIHTSIARDGTLEGPDIEGTNRIAEVSGLPVVLSGGIGSVEDIQAIADRGHERLIGVIVGKALYEHRVELSDLLGRFQTETAGTVDW